MIKLLAIICLSVGLSIVSSQSCSDTTSLRTLYGFGNTVTTPATSSGLNYCTSLKTGTVCCTASDVNSLQTKSDALIANLTSTVATRDKYFKSVNKNVEGQLETAAKNFATALQTFSASAAASSETNLALIVGLGGISTGVANVTAELATATASPSLSTFQSARTTCVVEIVNLQNAAWCLSCDPNAATKGYNPTTGALPLGSDACTRLKNACYPFVSIGSYQSNVIGAIELVNEMNKFSGLLTKLANGQGSAADFVYTSTDPAVGDIPDSCTSAANCDWICTDLWNNGNINQEDVVAGGDTADGEDDGRLLADRSLQSGSFNPSDTEAGTTVTFQNDPGNTATGVLSFGSVLVGAVVLLSSYLL